MTTATIYRRRTYICFFLYAIHAYTALRAMESQVLKDMPNIGTQLINVFKYNKRKQNQTKLEEVQKDFAERLALLLEAPYDKATLKQTLAEIDPTQKNKKFFFCLQWAYQQSESNCHSSNNSFTQEDMGDCAVEILNQWRKKTKLEDIEQELLENISRLIKQGSLITKGLLQEDDFFSTIYVDRDIPFLQSLQWSYRLTKEVSASPEVIDSYVKIEHLEEQKSQPPMPTSINKEITGFEHMVLNSKSDSQKRSRKSCEIDHTDELSTSKSKVNSKKTSNPAKSTTYRKSPSKPTKKRTSATKKKQKKSKEKESMSAPTPHGTQRLTPWIYVLFVGILGAFLLQEKISHLFNRPKRAKKTTKE